MEKKIKAIRGCEGKRQEIRSWLINHGGSEQFIGFFEDIFEDDQYFFFVHPGVQVHYSFMEFNDPNFDIEEFDENRNDAKQKKSEKKKSYVNEAQNQEKKDRKPVLEVVATGRNKAEGKVVIEFLIEKGGVNVNELSGYSETEPMLYYIDHNHDIQCKDIRDDFFKQYDLHPRIPEIYFKPFEPVLARDFMDEPWQCDMYSHTNRYDGGGVTYSCVGGTYLQCVPFKGNEDLYENNYKYDCPVSVVINKKKGIPSKDTADTIKRFEILRTMYDNSSATEPFEWYATKHWDDVDMDYFDKIG